MDYHLALKKMKILIGAITQINPENIMLTEVSQTSKDKYSMPPLLHSSIPRGVKFKEADSRKVVTVSRTGSGAKRNGDLVFNEHRASAAR